MENMFKLTPDKKFIFTGEKLQCFIPKRYENRGLMVIRDPITTLGIFEMATYNKGVVTPTYDGLILPTLISTYPDSISSAIRRGIDCYVFEYKKNQVFINENQFVKHNNLAYAIFREFIYLGNFPRFLTYNQAAFLFDMVIKATGAKLDIDHSIFEMIYSHLFRSADDTSVKYRYTNMKKPPVFIELKSISEGPDSTSAKLYGSFFVDGLNSALTTKSEYQSELENLLRG